MNRFAYFLVSLPLLLTFLGSVEAGPACAHRNQGTDACAEACGDKWGWPGHIFGTDRWGPVVTKTATGSDVLAAATTKACRARSSGPVGEPATAPANAPGSASVSSDISVSTPVSSAVSPHFSILKPTGFTYSRVWTRSPGCSRSHRRRPTSSPVQFSSAEPTTSSVPVTTVPTTSSPTTIDTTSTPTTPATTSTPTTPTTTSTPHTTSTSHTTSTPTTTSTPHTTVVKTTSTQSAPQPSSTSSSGQTSQSDIDAYLTAHNSIRKKHGAADLTWSDELAAAAQSWADKCVVKHSGGSLGPYGENLAAGTGSAYGIASAVRSWTNEVKYYDSSNPQPSHFTQVVWKGSKQLGCAVAECSGVFDPKYGIAKFYVCEYSPAGNVLGEFAQNVQA